MKPWIRRISLPFWGTVVLLTFTLGGASLTDSRKPDSLRLPLDTIPKEIAGWKLERSEVLSDQVLGVLLPTSYLLRDYKKADVSTQLFIAFYSLQRAGETMHSPKACLPGTGWEFAKRSTAAIDVDHQEVSVNVDMIQNADKRMWLVYWYQSGDRVIADEYLGKVLLVRDALVRGRTSGAFVRITVPDAPGASDQSLAIAQQVIPRLAKCFRQ